MNPRLEQIQHWLHVELGLASGKLLPASADASFRRYFRLYQPGRSLIVMDAPPEHEDIRPFERINRILEGHGVHVPHIHASCAERGLMLLEDLGDTPYLACLNEVSVDRLYDDAMATLLLIQTCPTEGLLAYDDELLLREMRLFDSWYLERHLGLRLGEEDRKLLERVYAMLSERARAQPQVFVHRDYHSRNLMVTDQRSPGVIDFQDAVVGPLTYDLVSLLRDSYIEWPEERVMQWAGSFHQRVREAGLSDVVWATFRQDFDWMSAQRHLKVAGIFARLHHRDGKSGYLKDIPLTLRNLKKAVSPYPEFTEFSQWLETRLPHEAWA
ncbi:MAG: aminoglycoside phosphotransferase family protein [Pseudomonadota bacterium]|jgi:aminoglycoside/choline kinase family phosphotransferase